MAFNFGKTPAPAFSFGANPQQGQQQQQQQQPAFAFGGGQQQQQQQAAPVNAFGANPGGGFGGFNAPSTPTTTTFGARQTFGAAPAFGNFAATPAANPPANAFQFGGQNNAPAPVATGFGAAAPKPAFSFGGAGGFGAQTAAPNPVATNAFGGGGLFNGGGAAPIAAPLASFQPQPSFAGAGFGPGAGMAGMGQAASQYYADCEGIMDSISSLAVNGFDNIPTTAMVVCGWDNSVTIYQVDEASLQTRKISTLQHTAPILCSDHLKGSDVFLFGDASGNVISLDITSNPLKLVAVAAAGPQFHEQAVRCLKVTSPTEFITAGWDNKLILWDTRQPKSFVGALPLNPAAPTRAYAMDANDQWIVVGTADKNITVWTKQNLQQPYAQYALPKYQIRSIALFAKTNVSGRMGFCCGTIDGRVHIEYMDEIHKRIGNPQNVNFEQKNMNLTSFNFKCHRETSEIRGQQGIQKTTKIFTVNAIHFNSKHNTFLTAGSDGLLDIWDADNKTKVAPLIGSINNDGKQATWSLKQPNKLPGNYEYACPITHAKFSPNSRLCFVAHSYDWSRGHEEFDYHKANYPNTVSVFAIPDDFIKPKQKQAAPVGGGNRR